MLYLPEFFFEMMLHAYSLRFAMGRHMGRQAVKILIFIFLPNKCEQTKTLIA